MYSKLPEAHKRPMTWKERFRFFLFIAQLFFSRFGIFVFFLCLNNLDSFLIKAKISEPNSKILSPNYTEKLSIQSSSFRSLSEKLSKINNLNSIQDSQSLSLKQSNLSKHLLLNLMILSKFYCIIATIVTLFLNPQQTKYFGGLAIELKQAGLFSKYEKSETVVSITSWALIFVFFLQSFLLARSGLWGRA